MKTADLYDEYGVVADGEKADGEETDGLRVLHPIFRDYGGVTTFSGPIVTVKAYEDNTLIRETVSMPGNGSVLVVDGGESLRVALLGDQLAQKALDNGWHGVVIAGCIRDADIVGKIPIGVKAIATNPRKCVKRDQGLRNIPIEIAGVIVHPGEWLYADSDGIVIADKKLV